MATRKKPVLRRFIAVTLGYTLLEIIIASSITVVLIQLMLQMLLINSKIIKTNDMYLNATYNSQYLYWLFHHHLVENMGISYIERIIEKNTKVNNSLNKLCLERLVAKNFSNLENVIVSSAKSINTIKELEPELKKNSHKIDLNSDILIVKTNVVNVSPVKLSSTARLREICPEIFYDDRFIVYFVSNGKLYKLSDSRAEELIDGVIKMKIKKIIKLTHIFYRFEIFYRDLNKPVIFAIKTLALMPTNHHANR